MELIRTFGNVSRIVRRHFLLLYQNRQTFCLYVRSAVHSEVVRSAVRSDVSKPQQEVGKFVYLSELSNRSEVGQSRQEVGKVHLTVGTPAIITEIPTGKHTLPTSWWDWPTSDRFTDSLSEFTNI